MALEQGFLSPEISGFISDATTRYKTEITQFTAINKRAIALQNEIAVHKGPARPLLSAVLYVRILGNAQAVFMLAMRGMVPQARTMLRALMEAIFALRYCLVSEELARTYLTSDEAYRLKFFDRMKKLEGTGFLPDAVAAATPEVRGEIEAAIKENAAREVSAYELADKGGLLPWYLSMYALCSSAVHSRVRSLQDHFDGKAEQIIGVGNPDLSETGKDIDTVSDMLLIAIESVSAFFNVDCAAFIAEQRATLHPRLKN